jgi:protein-S-isoprenylcysteine O-methyltransferase Ste14
MMLMGRDWKGAMPMTLIGVLFTLQIAIGPYILPQVSQNLILAYLGVGLYSVSGIVFGMLPVFEFRKKGAVKRGESYVHTTRVVDSGLYSIVRHPQYLTWAFWAMAGMLLFQHWTAILLGIPSSH